jgi:hypothetical protein
LRAVVGRVRAGRGAGFVSQVPQPLAVTLNQTPCAMPLVLATELITLGRIVARRRPVTHSGQFCRGEQLELPHGNIVSHNGRKMWTRSMFDHANLWAGADTISCLKELYIP